MSLTRGDVVLANFPFTDATGAKKRPGVVVQSERNNRRLNSVIGALVTSNIQRAAHEPTQLLVDIATPDGQRSGLLHSSAIKCEHLLTVHVRLVDRVIGQLSPSLMKQLDACLKASLDLT